LVQVDAALDNSFEKRFAQTLALFCGQVRGFCLLERNDYTIAGEKWQKRGSEHSTIGT
jgi:hypothetical protein